MKTETLQKSKMYLRAVHAETSIAALRQLIRDNPLGVLTTAIPSATYPLIQSTHIPWVLDVDDESNEEDLGRLRGHLARANPQSKAMIDSIKSRTSDTSASFLEQEVLVLFTSQVHHYVTPKFYVETKPTTGKVVGTWNYAAVQAYGRAKIYFDHASEESSSFLMKQLGELSDQSDRRIMGYTGTDGKPSPWKISEAPEKYIELLRKAIIGIEIEIDRLEGKAKMSQELAQGDRDGVLEGFRAMDSDLGHAVANMVEERTPIKVNGSS